jgi:hypothetical protein
MEMIQIRHTSGRGEEKDMTAQSVRLSLFVCFAFLATLTLVASPLRAQRICCQGDEWLKLNHQVREWYVIGYVSGYSDGHKEGCEHGLQAQSAADDPGDYRHRCTEQQLDFSKGTDFLVKSLTDFYTKYPDARDIYIYEVLDSLGKNLTLEEIHKYPFMRHKVPN